MDEAHPVGSIRHARKAKPVLGRFYTIFACRDGHCKLGVEIGPSLEQAFREAARRADEAFRLRRDPMSMSSADDLVGLPETVEFPSVRTSG